MDAQTGIIVAAGLRWKGIERLFGREEAVEQFAIAVGYKLETDSIAVHNRLQWQTPHVRT